MGIDVEDVKLCVCRIAHFSLRVSYSFVQNHPYVSGIWLFIFILYIFLPSFLSFLFYSLPFLGFIVILLAFWTSKSSTIQCEKGEDKSESSENVGLVNRNRSAYLRNATSQRRRFREKSEAWNVEAPIDASVSRIDPPVETNSFVHYTSEDKNIEVSGEKDPILGSELLVKSEFLGLEGSSSQTNKSDSGGDETKNESSSEGEDEDEEETQEDGNKAVEWTEDDQKNLMDLGLSEIERNRRLESLIARRRARKSCKRKVEETRRIIPPGQIAKVVTTKNDPFDVPNCSKEMEGGLLIPGSAPSVLLPMRNPFDLPYDPLEEKPNLMADSFHQEFTAAHLKDLSFCRHESFCFGPSFPSEDEGGGMGYPRFRRPSDKGNHDWLIEQILFKGNNQVPQAEKTRNVLEIGDSLQIKDYTDTTMTSNIADVNGMEMDNAEGKKILPNTESEFELEPELIQDSNDESSPSFSSENPEDVIGVNNGVVLETYESTVSNELDTSFNFLVPESRLIKDPLSDFSPSAFEKNKMEDRFSFPDKVICHTPTYSIASDMQVEVSEIGSPPLTVDGNNSQTDGESLSQDWETEKEMNFGSEELWGTSSDLSRGKANELKSRDVDEANEENINNVELSGIDMNSGSFEQDDINTLLGEVPNEITSDLQEVNFAEEVRASRVPDASAPETLHTAMQSTEELINQPPHYVLFQKPEESSNPLPDDIEKALSHVIDQKDAAADALGDMENLTRTGEDIDGGLEILMKQEDDSKDSSGSRVDLDYLESQEGYNNLVQIIDNGDLAEPNLHGSDTDRLMPSETKEQFINDIENQIDVAETEFQNSNNAVKMIVDEDSFIERVPLIVQELVDTTTQPSNTRHVEKSQEPPKHLETYDEEARPINNLDESILGGKTDGENSEDNKAARRESEISIIIEDCNISPKLPLEDSISNDNKPKIIEEEDGNKPVYSTDVENEIIKDLSEQNVDKSNLDINEILSASNPMINTDKNISENMIGEVVTNPLIESPVQEVRIESELAPVDVTNIKIETVGKFEDESESHRFTKQDSKLHESNIAEDTNSSKSDYKEMEGNSKNLNENEDVIIPSKLEGEMSNSKLLKDGEEERNVTGLQTPGSRNENVGLKEDYSVESSLSG